MTTPQVFRLRDYELVCSARAVDSGKFEPALVISRNVWPSRPRVIAVQRGHFLNEDAAIESARAQGIEWINNYG